MKPLFSSFLTAKRGYPVKACFEQPVKASFGQTAVRLTLALTVLVITGPLLLSSGCGGASSGKSSLSVPTRKTGGLSVSVKWPERSRLIPDASESIVVTVVKATPGGTTIAPVTLTRPAAGESLTTVASFDDLPVGDDYTVTAVAYPNPDATGNPQARSSGRCSFFCC